MTTVINAPKALELLIQIVEERGHYYFYEKEQGSSRCLYWHGSINKPGCLVGQALHRAGVTRDHLIGLDDYPGAKTASHLHDRDLGDIRVTEKAAEVFQAAQYCQDGGGSWGEALNQATTSFVIHRLDGDEPTESQEG